MSILRSGLPFEDNEGVQWRTLTEVLRYLNYRELMFTGTSDAVTAEKFQIAKYRESVRSLVLIDHEEYARFLQHHVETGGRIDTVTERLHREYPTTIFKTTLPYTFLPDCDGRIHLHVMIQYGHKLGKENLNDHSQVYDLNRQIPMPRLELFRDTANIMLQNGWKPHEDHFAPTYNRYEIDKLLARGRKKIYGPAAEKK